VAVLAVLATIVVIAVGATRDESEAQVCVSDRTAVETAIVAWREQAAGPLTEEALVASGTLDRTSSLHDVTSAGAVFPAPGSVCAALAAGGQAAPPAAPSPLATGAVTVPTPTGDDDLAALLGITTAPPAGGAAPEAPAGAAAPPAAADQGGGASPPATAAPAATDVPTAPPAAGAAPDQGGTVPAGGGDATPSPSGPGGVVGRVLGREGDDATVKSPAPVPLPAVVPAPAATAPASAGLEVTLSWTGNADLDLWARAPDGNFTGWSAPATTGRLDTDEIPVSPAALGPHVERITWSPGSPAGSYLAWLRVESDGWGPQGTATYTLTVRSGDEVLAATRGAIGSKGTDAGATQVRLGS
jgi:hypothetical protein